MCVVLRVGGRRSAESKRLVGRISHNSTAEINWQSFGAGPPSDPIQDDDFEIPNKEKLIPYVLGWSLLFGI